MNGDYVYSKQHNMALALIYMNPVYLEGHMLTPEELANYMENSFLSLTETVKLKSDREFLLKCMENGLQKRDLEEKDDIVKLWTAAMYIIKSRGEYM